MTNHTTKKIPIYKGHWLWKSMFEFPKDPITFFQEKSKIHGDTFYVKFPTEKILITANPSLTKHILTTNHKNYPKSATYDNLSKLLGNGLVTSKGDFWRKQRRIAQPIFLKKNMEILFQSMVQVVDDYIIHLGEQQGDVIELANSMAEVTAKVVLKALFSENNENSFQNFYNILNETQKYVLSLGRYPFVKYVKIINGEQQKFLDNKRQLYQFIQRIIEKREKNTQEYFDFLQMLMNLRYEDTGKPMESQQLLDELITIFFAGHETSANALTWIIYSLIQHPYSLNKLKGEISFVLSEKDSPRFEDLNKLIFTRQVIEEGMRLFPPVWSLSRTVLKKDKVDGYILEEGTLIVIMIHGLHIHQELWKEPEKFNPERFKNDKGRLIPKHHYLPFGAGPRMCIGNHFAMMEMQLLLVLMIKNFDFELIKTHPVELEPLVTLRPKHGIKLKIK